MKEEALQFLKAFAESPEGQNNKTIVREMGSLIYRTWPSKEVTQQVNAITNSKQAQPTGSGGNGWKVFNRSVPKPEKKNMVPLSRSASPVAPPQLQKQVKKEVVAVVNTEVPEATTLTDLGVTENNFNELLSMDVTGFTESFGKDGLEKFGKVLKVDVKGKRAKALYEIQKAIANQYQTEDATVTN